MSLIHPASFDLFPVGIILESAFLPDSNWLWCAGQLLAIADYSELYSKAIDPYPYGGIVNNWKGVAADYNVVVWNGSQYVAIKSGTNTIGRTTDGLGLVWEVLTNLPTTNTRSFAYNGSVYVLLLATQTTTSLYYSSNLSTWTAKSLTDKSFYMLVSSGSYFALAPYSNYMYFSSDGNNWTKRTTPANVSKVYPYGNGNFILSVNASPDWYYSTDQGVNWTVINIPMSYYGAFHVATDGTRFVFLGQGTSYVTENFTDWEIYEIPIFSTFGNGSEFIKFTPDFVFWDGTKFIAWHEDAVTYIISSVDGVEWKFEGWHSGENYSYPMVTNETTIVANGIFVHTIGSNYYDKDVYFQLPRLSNRMNPTNVRKMIKVK
jgi:hypothetical protein